MNVKEHERKQEVGYFFYDKNVYVTFHVVPMPNL